jgi:hypothetical protein
LGINHLNAQYPENAEYIIPSPLVNKINSHLNPSNHLVGISNSNVVNQFSDFIVCIIHLRLAILSMTLPAKLSSTLIISCSIGSFLCQFSVLKIT